MRAVWRPWCARCGERVELEQDMVDGSWWRVCGCGAIRRASWGERVVAQLMAIVGALRRHRSVL